MTPRASRWLPIALVILVGITLGAFILGTQDSPPADDEHAHETQGHEPADADEEAHGAAVDEGPRLTDAQLAQYAIGIRVAGPARLREQLALIGEIGFNEDRMVHVVPRLAGVVQAVTVNAGDRVTQGQRLATLSSQSLSDQRSELLAAEKRLSLARASFTREKKLWADQISAEQDYLQAQHDLQEAEIALANATQKLASLGDTHWRGSSLTRYDLLAPIDGVVIEKHLSLGEAVKDDASVFVIADLSTVWAEMTVYARDLDTIQVGQTARVTTTAFDATASGTVSYVGPLVGTQTRAAKARLVLPNPDGRWRPGLPVNIEVTAGEVDVAVAITASALQTLDEASVVFRRDGEVFTPRPVRTGRSDGELIEILDGLAAGEAYAAHNSFLVKAELGKAGASHEH